jgi:hypothetical protein
MSGRGPRLRIAFGVVTAVILGVATLGTAGCTGPGGAASPGSLVAFGSCADALGWLRGATLATTSADGISDAPRLSPADAAGGPAPGRGGPAASLVSLATPLDFVEFGSGDYPASAVNSGSGVDGPDVVKTDGRRIVILGSTGLTVVDAATHRITGTLRLPGGPDYGPTGSGMLLDGDRALVLESGRAPLSAFNMPLHSRTHLFLISVSGTPRLLSAYSIDGETLDARAMGPEVRIVTQTYPAINPPPYRRGSDMLAANRAAVMQAGLGAWLPGFTSTGGGVTVTGSVPCSRVLHSAAFAGTSMLTMETFDLSAAGLGTGNPVSVAAGADTVYGSASSLYLASGGIYSAQAIRIGGIPTRKQTQIYRFDIGLPGPPRFAASGSVPGYLMETGGLSEWDGYLRVATTTGSPSDGLPRTPSDGPPATSAIYELSLTGPTMTTAGQLTGLWPDKTLFSVQYLGPVGYIAAIGDVDPLLAVDLSNPAHPRSLGRLPLAGAPTYVQPASPTRQIVITTFGTQEGVFESIRISLYDVPGPGSQTLLSTDALTGLSAPGAADQPSFLYAPRPGLILLHVRTSQDTRSSYLAVRLAGSRITQVSYLNPPVPSTEVGIQRALITGQTLWTVWPAGLMASSLGSLREEAWLPLSAA